MWSLPLLARRLRPPSSIRTSVKCAVVPDVCSHRWQSSESPLERPWAGFVLWLPCGWTWLGRFPGGLRTGDWSFSWPGQVSGSLLSGGCGCSRVRGSAESSCPRPVAVRWPCSRPWCQWGARLAPLCVQGPLGGILSAGPRYNPHPSRVPPARRFSRTQTSQWEAQSVRDTKPLLTPGARASQPLDGTVTRQGW